MKFLTFSAIAMLGLSASGALAQSCPSPMNQSAVQSLVTNQYVCGSIGGDSWNELHQAGGVLQDYKKGPTDPVDPSAVVGNWTVNSDGTITYAYGSLSYTYQVQVNAGNQYSFCGTGGAPTLFVTINPAHC